MSTAYRTIVADPPWTMPAGGPHTANTDNYFTNLWASSANKPSDLPYGVMTLAAIKALPVADHAAADAHLYLWVPNAFLADSFDVARAWGFKPSQMLVWCKTPRGLGPGGAYANTTEFVLFARRGRLAPITRHPTTWWHFKRPFAGRSPVHSRKPDGFQDVIEQVSPGPYLELFARRRRLGWDVWGDQIDSDVDLFEAAS